jgi:drug/metabolite transporter (DMT)-like permease
LNFSKYIVLFCVAAFASLGDFCLKVGMNQRGAIAGANLHEAFLALFNPWVALGTLFLIGFFVCYLSALSWADLTYVLPATALGYVFMAVLSVAFLHERVSVWRWAGIFLITTAVGFVANQPHKTSPPTEGLHP